MNIYFKLYSDVETRAKQYIDKALEYRELYKDTVKKGEEGFFLLGSILAFAIADHDETTAVLSDALRETTLALEDLDHTLSIRSIALTDAVNKEKS